MLVTTGICMPSTFRLQKRDSVYCRYDSRRFLARFSPREYLYIEPFLTEQATFLDIGCTSSPRPLV